MADHEGKISAAGDGGTMRSPEGSASPRGWTEEEMRGAVPLPLPTVEAEAQAVPHAGRGMTSAGGAPEEG